MTRYRCLLAEMSIWQMLWDAELQCWCFLPWTAAVVCLAREVQLVGRAMGEQFLEGMAGISVGRSF